ncbi:MAG: Ig domain-containing protein [Verrucomicrobiota bacterium]
MLLIWFGSEHAALSVVTFTNTPTAVSNTYNGTISLFVNGLTNGETVVVQKFLDANANGIIDKGDLLIQQFKLTVGTNFVIGGVTNFNVPGDLNSSTSEITTTLNFQSGDFTQNIIGDYLYRLSSPVGHFPPMTNDFMVTNYPYAQKISGNVVSNYTSTAVANAIVLLFPPPRAGNHGPGTPIAGAVANSSGSFSIQAPPGTYVPLAFRNNYVADYSAAPVINLGSNSTITTNLALSNASSSISGQIVDANNPAKGLPAIFIPVTASINGQIFIGVSFSDTNGYFTNQVISGQWNVGEDDSGLIIHAYVGYQNATNVNSGAVGINLAYPKASALFYGRVTDGSGNPLANVDIGCYDNNEGLYEADGYTDSSGNYVVGVVGGLGNGDPWWVGPSSESSAYVFSEPVFDQNGGTNISGGQAALVDFTGLPATNYITGNVEFNGTNIVGVGVSAYATINGLNYSINTVDTDSDGNYTLAVPNGVWSVNLSCQGGNDSLDNLLGSTNYVCPNNQNVTINGTNGTANFSIQTCSGAQIFTTSLPYGQVGSYYDNFLQGSTCNGNMIWSLVDPQDFPSTFTFNSDGEFFGTPATIATYSFSVQLSDGNGNSVTQALTLTISGGSLQITTTSLPNGTNGMFYSQTLQASGGIPPYSWSIPDYSASLPANLTLATNGSISGILSTSLGFYQFDVVVTDSATNSQELDGLSLDVVNPPLPPLMITNTSLPNGTIGVAYSVQLGASGGQSPYNWSLVSGSANPPLGLTLYPSGIISGTPTTNKVSAFKVQVNDQDSDVTNKLFSVTINPKPVLDAVHWLTNQFEMLLIGASNQNYTVQTSTNLHSPNWVSLLTTNNTKTNAFIITDASATNSARYYRIVIGP